MACDTMPEEVHRQSCDGRSWSGEALLFDREAQQKVRTESPLRFCRDQSCERYQIASLMRNRFQGGVRKAILLWQVWKKRTTSADKKQENSQGQSSKEALYCPTMGWLQYTVAVICDFGSGVVYNLQKKTCFLPAFLILNWSVFNPAGTACGRIAQSRHLRDAGSSFGVLPKTLFLTGNVRTASPASAMCSDLTTRGRALRYHAQKGRSGGRKQAWKPSTFAFSLAIQKTARKII